MVTNIFRNIAFFTSFAAFPFRSGMEWNEIRKESINRTADALQLVTAFLPMRANVHFEQYSIRIYLSVNYPRDLALCCLAMCGKIFHFPNIVARYQVHGYYVWVVVTRCACDSCKPYNFLYIQRVFPMANWCERLFLSPLRCINSTTNIKYVKSVDCAHIHTRSIIPPLKHSTHIANFLPIQPCVTRDSIQIFLIFPKFIRFHQSKLWKKLCVSHRYHSIRAF